MAKNKRKSAQKRRKAVVTLTGEKHVGRRGFLVGALLGGAASGLASRLPDAIVRVAERVSAWGTATVISSGTVATTIIATSTTTNAALPTEPTKIIILPPGSDPRYGP